MLRKYRGAGMFVLVLGSMFAGSSFVQYMLAPDMSIPKYDAELELAEQEDEEYAENEEEVRTAESESE